MLSLEIVTRRGRRVFEEDLAEIVFRRREERFEQGSEVAIFPGHAPMLMQNAGGDIRWKDRKDVIHHYEVEPGLVEVLDNRVLVVTDVARLAAG
jgi:F0F1-type ATP synthase epsilon subunit